MSPGGKNKKTTVENKRTPAQESAENFHTGQGENIQHHSYPFANCKQDRKLQRSFPVALTMDSTITILPFPENQCYLGKYERLKQSKYPFLNSHWGIMGQIYQNPQIQEKSTE